MKTGKTLKRTLQTLLNFRRLQTSTLIIMLHGNRIYGLTILVQIVSLLPSNTTIFMDFLVHSDINGYKWLLTPLLLGQIIIMLAFHWLAALLSNRIHSLYKKLPSSLLLLSRRKNSIPIGFAISLLNHYQTFHVRRKYGITYASFGLISMAAFFKVRAFVRWSVNGLIVPCSLLQFVLLYNEVFMYNYTSIKNGQF